MLSKRQKAACLATGSAATATLIWLRYAKSASTTRNFIKKGGTSARQAFGGILRTLTTIRERIEEFNRIVGEIAQIGSDHKTRTEMVINDTLAKLDQTASTIRRNVTQSSDEITALLKDIRTAVRESISPQTSKAA